MAPPRKLLVADPDPATARALAPALRQRGWQVFAARDGSRALQLAVLRFPDLVLFDERCPLVDARTFARILRTNPRTERIPVVVLGEHPDPDRARLGAFLQKPLRQEEVLARADRVLRRAEASRAVAGERGQLEGSLAQIPLVDLLQILGVNRKSGRLVLERGGERAEVQLRDGRIADAAAGAAVGEKALFRLLTRRDGSFAFHAEEAAGPARIERRTDELVLEGLRQADEAAALLPSLPGAADLVELAVDPEELPPGLHPVTAEVVELLARPQPLATLVDRARATDLEVLRAVAALLEKGWARRGTPPPAAEAPPFLDPAERHQLRARVSQGRPSGAQAVGKVVVAGGGPLSLRAALARLAALPGFAGEAEPGALGTLGRLDLGDGVRVDLCRLPLDRDLLPATRAFAAGALGALVLLPAEGLGEEHAALLRDLRLPAVVCGPAGQALPGPLAEGPAPASLAGADAAEALRLLLSGAARRPARPTIAPP
jgi:DNA-binding response OmpR family regulator